MVVEHMIDLASMFRVSLFSIGFIVSSIGSDLPEIVNGILSAYLGHGDISVGDSFGSINIQSSLVLGLIPFFCTFCRLIPRSFAIVGFIEVFVIFSAVFLSADGFVSRFDSIILIMLWFTAMLLSKRLSKEKITVEKSEEMVVKEKRISKTIMFLLIGFVGISVGSYLVIESIISISSVLGISKYFISFFLLSLSTSLPELMVAISAIKKRYFELAVGDIIGSCIVDATLSIGIGSLLFPIKVNRSHILVTGLYAGLVSSIIVSLLSYRQVNDKKSGALFLILYLITWIIPILL